MTAVPVLALSTALAATILVQRRRDCARLQP
jgi:hypothetical protein